MEKKNIDWGNLGFGYVQTDYRFVSDFKNGSWDEGKLTEDATVVINECAGVLQYAQTVFEGMKAYTTEDGRIVTFRPDLNAERMENSAKRLVHPGRCGHRKSQRRLRSAFWFRSYPLYPSLYVWDKSGHRCKTC